MLLIRRSDEDDGHGAPLHRNRNLHNSRNEDSMIGAQGETQVDSNGQTQLVFRRWYPDPVEDIWAAVTVSDRLRRWIGTWTGEPCPGGSVMFTMSGEADAGSETPPPIEVKIVECIPPHRLVVEMPGDGSADAWHLSLTVTQEEGGTVLMFSQRLIDDTDTTDVAAGWRWYLDRLTASITSAQMPRWDDYLPGRSAEGAPIL
jgi:uncharacterized protein YndB with AHSA1/START domain